MHSEQHRPTCFKYGDQCRMGYPREIVEETFLNEKHLLKLSRSHPWVVPFIRRILYCCRCNMDGRYLASGRDAVAVSRYTTDYVTKPQKRFENTFPVVATAIRTLETRADFNSIDRSTPAGAQDAARRMVIRCLNKLAGESLKCGPEVAAYLLGFPTFYSPYQFVTLNLNTIIRFVDAERDAQSGAAGGEGDDVMIRPAKSGKLILICTRLDYVHREGLSSDDDGLYWVVSDWRKVAAGTRPSADKKPATRRRAERRLLDSPPPRLKRTFFDAAISQLWCVWWVLQSRLANGMPNCFPSSASSCSSRGEQSTI